MKYSVIIPIYRSEKTIRRCLDSFLNQSVSNSLEILCIGDKVDDPTHSIVNEYIDKYPGKVYLHLQDGRGIGGARNLGLDLAKGEYIMFSDADDHVSPYILEKCFAALDEHSADYVCVGYERVSETGKRYSSEMIGDAISVVELDPENISRLAFISPAPWGKLFKRELIGDSRFADNPLSAYEDLFFSLCLYPKVKKYVLLPEILYHYIVYTQSSVSKSSYEKTERFRLDLTAVREHYLASKLSADYLSMLDIVAMIHAGIADVHRMAENPSVELRSFCVDAKSYLNENFPGWKKIKLRPYKCITLRCTAVWCAKLLYKLNMFWVFIRVYNRIIKSWHIDVKW